MDWQVRIVLDTYQERLEEAQRSYEVYEALYANRKGTEISSRVLRSTGLLFVGLGKRLQRRAGTATDARQAEIC